MTKISTSQQSSVEIINLTIMITTLVAFILNKYYKGSGKDDGNSNCNDHSNTTSNSNKNE